VGDPRTKVVITAEDKASAVFGQVQNSIGKLSAAMPGLAAALSVGGFTAMIKSTIDAADEMNDLSQKIGIAVKDLGTWKLAAESSGTSMESIAKGVKGLSGYMHDHAKELKAAGITATDAGGAMTQLADIFKAMPDGVEKTALAVKLFGKSGMDMIPMLNLGSSGLKEMTEKSAEYGRRLAILAPQADKFNDLLAEMSLQSKAAAINIGIEVVPSLIKFTEQLLEGKRIAGGWTAALWEFGVLLAPEAIPESLNRTRVQLEKLHAEMAKGKAQNLSDGGMTDLSEVDRNIAIGERRKKYLEFLQRQSVMENAAKLGDYRDARDLAKDNRGVMSAAEAEAKTRKLNAPTAASVADVYTPLIKSLTNKVAAQEADVASLEKLNPAQKEYAEFLAQAGAGLIKFTPVQMRDLAVKWDVYLRLSALNVAEKEWADAVKKSQEAVEKSIESLREKATAAELELATYGMTKSEIENTIIARLEEQRAIADGWDSQEGLVSSLNQEIDARKRLRDAMSGIEARDAAKKAIDDQRREWEKFTDQIDQSLTDALMRGFEAGKGGGQNFVDSLKHTLETAALKVVVQAIVNPVTGAIGQVLGGSGASGGASSLLSAGSSASNLFSGGGGLYQSFAMSEMGSSLGLSTAFIDGIGTGIGAGGTALTALGTALPWIGGALALGGALGLFGGGGDDPHDNASLSGFHFNLGKSGVNPGAASFIGGATRGSGWWGENTALSKDQQAALKTRAEAAFAQAHDNAKMLGTDSKEIDKASVSSDRNGNPGAAGYPGYWSSIDQAFNALGDSLAVKVIPNLKSFQATGESLAQTASRLTQEFTLTNKMAAMMGKDGAAVFGGTNLKARDQLVGLLGGLSGATTAVEAYYNNYHSTSERTADTRSSIASTLRGLGIADVPATREQFRILVESQDLATESGRKMYATLLSVADAFAGITQTAGDAAKSLNQNRFKTRADYIYAQRTGVMPHYAAGGSHGGGWAMVGESGPEIAYMPPSRIYSNADSKTLVDMAPVIDAIESLRADMRAVNATLARQSIITAKTLDKWDADGMPAVRV
jgi:hypothetical protein